jgi:aryl-alcohol dehydrogenase-like predicted oxidoreductase
MAEAISLIEKSTGKTGYDARGLPTAILGKTGVRIPRIAVGLGSRFCNLEKDEDAFKILNHALDNGLYYWDTACDYENKKLGFTSEGRIGEVLKTRRKEVFICTKVDSRDPDEAKRQIERSLKRLQTDYLDVYFIHHFDEVTPLEDTLRTLDDLVRQGKVLYLGASNFAAWQVMKALGVSAKEGLAPFAVLQPMYNLVKRQAEVEILPMAEAEELGVITYSPLGGGMLTGKYTGEGKPEVGRFLVNKAYQARYNEGWIRETTTQFGIFARERGYDPAGLAVAWAGSHPAVTAPIIGARSLSQLEGSLKSLEIEMTPALREEISALSIEPPPATDRSDERSPETFTLRTKKGYYGTQTDRH